MFFIHEIICREMDGKYTIKILHIFLSKDRNCLFFFSLSQFFARLLVLELTLVFEYVLKIIFWFSFQIAASHSNLFSFLHSSLLYIQSDVLLYDVKEVVHEELQTLVDLGLVVQKRKTDLCDVSSPAKEKDNSDLTLEITKLGKATYKGKIYTSELQINGSRGRLLFLGE